MNNDYDINLVEKYFEQELTETETMEFNIRMETDHAFKALVDQEKVIIKGIHLDGLHRDLLYLQSLEKTLKQKPPGEDRYSKKIGYYAAAAVVTILSVIGIWTYTSSNSSEELFLTYYDKPYPNIFETTTRGSAPVPSSLRTDAFKAYDRKDFNEAARLFTELQKTEKDPGMLMLLGNSNLMIGQIEEAKLNFTTLLNDFDDLDLPAKWYLSLCYLKSGDVENARKMLKELGETEVSYATKAKELLKEVD